MSKSKGTFTDNLTEIISNGMVQVTKTEYYYDVFDETKEFDKDKFIKSLQALNNAGIFANIVDWNYDDVSSISSTEDFIIHGNIHDQHAGEIIIVYLLVNDGYSIDDVKMALDRTILTDLIDAGKMKWKKVINL